MLRIMSGIVPLVLVNVTVWAGVVSPTSWVPKPTGSGLAVSGPVSIPNALGPPDPTARMSVVRTMTAVQVRRMDRAPLVTG